LRALDPLSEAIILTSKTISVTLLNGTVVQQAISVSSVVMWTDYATLQLRFGCGTAYVGNKTYPYAFYFALARSRYFDSLDAFTFVLNMLKTTNYTLNDITFLYNSPSCPNSNIQNVY
jgi:hypothetical protein